MKGNNLWLRDNKYVHTKRRQGVWGKKLNVKFLKGCY